MLEVKSEIVVNAEDLTPEAVAGLDAKTKANLVAYFIAASVEIRKGIEVETVSSPTRTSAELESQIKLFSSLERISGCLSKIAGEDEGRIYAAQHHMYQARREELENRLAGIDDPSLAKIDTITSIADAIREKMPAQYRTRHCPETVEADAMHAAMVAAQAA